MVKLNNFDVTRLHPVKWVIQSVDAVRAVAYFNEPSGYFIRDARLGTIYDERPSPDLLAALAVRESHGKIQIVAVEVDVKVRLSSDV